jgi:hypothetical protein
MWKLYFYLLTAECCICMLVQRRARGTRATQFACTQCMAYAHSALRSSVCACLRACAQLVLLSVLPAAVRNPLKHVISKFDLPYAGQIGAAIGIALLAGNLPFITDTSDASGW